MKPNFKDLGLSYCMGPKLRQEVEFQLLKDLLVYRKDNDKLSFDWSASCIEGKYIRVLDGTLQNFSGIQLFDSKENLVADGWIDFVIDHHNVLIVYWKYLDLFEDGKEKNVAESKGVPEHIKRRLEND